MLDEREKLTRLAIKVLDDKGWDPYLEDEGTLWLLHYELAKNQVASIFNLILTELRKTKPEFERKHFYALVSSKGSFSEATLTKDFSVFQNTYVPLFTTKSEIEDSYSGILTELNLVVPRKIDGRIGSFIIESKRRPEIPMLIVLYAIVSNENYGHSINFDRLLNDKAGVGAIFALSREGLTEKLEEITKIDKNIIFKNDAGIRELQFKSKPKPFDILAKYYDRKV
jgi:hypothetical protein